MQHSETTINGEGGLTLYAQRWLPDGEFKAIVAIVHGIGEHSGRYANVVNGLTAMGFAVCGFDLRGHGKSEGARGHIDHWTQFRADVGHYLRWVRTWSTDLPVFLYGHSLGSAIVTDYAIHEGTSWLKGIIVSGLTLNPAGAVEPYLVTISKVMSKIAPRLALSTGLDANGLSRDRAVVKAYQEDPLVHDKASARFGTELIKTTDYIRDHPGLFTDPVLVLHGEDDPINLVVDVKAHFEKMGSVDKTLKVYTGMLHECQNELGCEGVVLDMADWMTARL